MASPQNAEHNLFSLEVVSPGGIIFKADVKQVVLPTVQGEITILAHHEPLFAKLKEGEAIILHQNKETSLAIIGGYVEVKNDKVSIITDYAVRSESIEIAKAEEAKKRAEEVMKEKRNTIDFIMAEKELQKSLLELKIGEKYRKRQRS